MMVDYAWFCGNIGGSCGESFYGPQEVGQKMPNGNGLYDMHGNLAEFVVDWYGCNFPSSPIDPLCAVQSSTKITKGGVYFYPAKPAQHTNNSFPDHHDVVDGARLVRTAP